MRLDKLLLVTLPINDKWYG